MPHGVTGFLLINLYNNTRNKTAGTHLQVVLIHHHAVCPLLLPLCLLHVTGGDKVALPCRFALLLPQSLHRGNRLTNGKGRSSD